MRDHTDLSMKRELYKRSFFIITAIILLFSFLIRSFYLSSSPPGFFADEAAIGYNAYKLLTNGADEYGVRLPIFFQSFGDYRLPIPIYANIPFVALFGLTEVSVRMTAIFFGLVSIFFLMLFMRELRGNLAGLCMGFLLMILPWHIHLSRWGSEYMYFPAFLSISLYFYVKSMKKPMFLTLSFVFLALTLYTYYPSLFITPLFLLAVILHTFSSQQHNRKRLAIACMIFLLLCIPLYLGYKNKTLMTRWNSVNAEKTSFSKKLLKGLSVYKDAYSPKCLFFKGDIGMPEHFVARHSVRGFGQLSLFQIILLPLGIILSLRKSRKGDVRLMLWLLLLYPLGSAITNDGILATRSVIGIIPLTFFSTVGLTAVCMWLLKKRYVAIRIFCAFAGAVIVLVSVFMYLHAFYKEYPLYSADFWGWQFGPKPIMQYFLKNKNAYDDLYMSGEFNGATIFPKFYDPTNICQNKCKIGDFMRNPEIYDPSRRQLFSLSPDYLDRSGYEQKFQTKKFIFYPNGTVAFKIGVIVQ